MPIQKSHLDTLDLLESELNSVLEEDSRYWTENDAKFRAVAQNVSYEQFEEIVKASHLKPLDKKDKSQLSEPKNTIWNSISKVAYRKTSNNEINNSNEIVQNSNDPRNISDFYACWKNKEVCDKISFIKELGQSKMREIFVSEVSSELIVELLNTFLSFKPSDVIVVVQTLELLSETKRFSLTVEFLSRSERQASAELLQRLRSALAKNPLDLAKLGVTELNIENIEKSFKIK